MRSSDNGFFWFWAMELEVNLFMFIRSVAHYKGNFSLFIRTLQNLLPYVFALDAMMQYSLNLEKDTSLSTRQTVPFPASDLTMLTSKIKKLSKEMGVQSVYLIMEML